MKFGLFLISVALLLSQNAWTQTTGLSGFDLRLYRPPSDGSGILNLHGSRLLRPWDLAVGLQAEQGHGLLAATNNAGQQVRVVNDMLTLNTGVAVGMTHFLQAGLNLPLVALEKGRNFDTSSGFSTASLGDIALDLKFGSLETRFGDLAFLSEVTLPTGSTGKFTGYRTVSYEGKGIFDKQIGPLYGVVNASYRTVGRTHVVNIDMDDMLTFGGGIAWTLPSRTDFLDLIGEVDGAKVLRSSQELTTPVEWFAGLRGKIGDRWSMQVGGGKGITSGVGGGEWRVIAGIQWGPQTKKAERREKAKLLETIYFRFNQDKFLPKYEPKLNAVAERLKARPKGRIKVKGHSDSEGPEEYNLDLSRRRAERVVKSLRDQSAGKEKIVIEAVGDKEPAADNQTFQGKAKNRRVEIFEISR